MVTNRWSKLVGGLVLALGMAAAPALAVDTGFHLEISPLPIELNSDPGRIITTDLRVMNSGTATEHLRVSLLKASEDDNGQVHLTKPTAQDEWTQWVQFSQTQITAQPGVWQTIKMTISLPKAAAFGYYFAVEYSNADITKPQGTQTLANGAVATFILLDVNSPGTKRAAEIAQFTADHSVYEFLPATFTAKIRAIGNIRVAPYGNVYIEKGGKQIYSLTINQTQGNVLPQSSRFFTASWNDGFPHRVTQTDTNGNPALDKQGKPQQHLVWDWGQLGKIRFGRYTAHLLMVYNDGQRDIPLEATVSFWVIPWRILGIVLVVLLILGFGVFGVVKGFTRQARRLRRRP